MGVNHLWNILEPVKRKENLSSLRSKTLCVDLSYWICEARCAKGLKQNVSKPHLRNLFFRLLYLTRLGVKLVFVVDGEPPELKWEAIVKRIQARNSGQNWRSKNPQKTVTGGCRVGRSHFAVWVRECCKLLDLFGLPYIESKGEAEALCAWLDLHQIVDGCITNDGDAFLYGARTVYRDLCISGKDASVECYRMEDIEAHLNLDRKTLVALAVLLGCDYLSQGVSGVGKEIAMKLIRTVNHDNLIDRFYEWTKSTCQENDLSSLERSVRSKALKDKNFPHHKVRPMLKLVETSLVAATVMLENEVLMVIQEFLAPRVVPSRVSLKILSPELVGLQEFCLKHLEWPQEYTREKVLPLITYWQMTSLLNHHSTILVQPKELVKARIQQKIECYEIEWQNVGLGETCPSSFVTIENRELVNQVYPDIEEEFKNAMTAKLLKKPKRKQAEKSSSSCDEEIEVDLLSKQMEELTVDQPPDDCLSSAISHKKAPSSDDESYADESLQEIMDSILPSTTDQHGNSMESLDFFEGPKNCDADLIYVGVACMVRKHNAERDVFKPLQMKFEPDNDEFDSVCKSNEENNNGLDSNECKNLEFKTARANPHVLDCNNYCERREKEDCSFYYDKSITPCTVRKAEHHENFVIDSSDEDDNSIGKEPCLKQRLNLQIAKDLKNNIDISEIFGTSDLWSSDNDEEVVNSLYKKPPLRSLSKETADLFKTDFQFRTNVENASLSCKPDATDSTTLEFEENHGENATKAPISNVLEDVSGKRLNTISHKDGDCFSKFSVTMRVGEKACRSFVKDPPTTTPIIIDAMKDAGSVRSPKKQQKQEALKENILNSSFDDDDDMTVPLLERIRKNLSARKKLENAK